MVMHNAKMCFYINAPYSERAKFFQASLLYKQHLKMTLFGIANRQLYNLQKVNQKLGGHFTYN